jgi:hypothetical protein
MKKLLLLVVVAVAAFAFWAWPRGPVFLPQTQSSAQPSYMLSPQFSGKVSIFDEGIDTISHIEITPDGNYMLAATLPGTVWIYHKTENGFVRQKDPFFPLQPLNRVGLPRKRG